MCQLCGIRPYSKAFLDDGRCLGHWPGLGQPLDRKLLCEEVDRVLRGTHQFWDWAQAVHGSRLSRPCFHADGQDHILFATPFWPPKWEHVEQGPKVGLEVMLVPGFSHVRGTIEISVKFLDASA